MRVTRRYRVMETPFFFFFFLGRLSLHNSPLAGWLAIVSAHTGRAIALKLAFFFSPFEPLSSLDAWPYVVHGIAGTHLIPLINHHRRRRLFD